jgi:hypothetical protein
MLPMMGQALPRESEVLEVTIDLAEHGKVFIVFR